MGFLDTFLDILKMFLPHFFIEARNVDLSISNQNGTTNLQKNKIKIIFFTNICIFLYLSAWEIRFLWNKFLKATQIWYAQGKPREP